MPALRPKTAAGTRPETQSWVRNPADEKALAAGMRFDPERADFACTWIETYCCLYEGEHAGEPMILLPPWRDFFSRLFGWTYESEDWGGWVRRFTHAAFWGAKKQGKSPSCAAYNLYMGCGDGEQGQKVYMMAGDGGQARISQMHAVMMVRQSPALDFEQGGDCKINNTTLEINHTPSNSRISIVTGDNVRAANKKHGYNGSVTVDEMHVVTRTMMDAVGRAGLSRREPIQASFSTAGSDTNTVGYERFKYGRQVNAGDRDDQRFLHVEYCAPDGAKDSDIEENLEAYGKMANPCWGTLIKPGQFREDWNNSKDEVRKVAIFKMERLNLWVGSTNNWLDSAAWAKSGVRFDLEDLRGRLGFAALDLSRTRDLTAFVMTFPWPEEGDEVIRLWPMFWMPEETAKARNHLFPFLSWAAAGAIKLTSGAVVDYSVVKADIRDAITRYDITIDKLYYDKHLANEITQALHEGETLGSESAPGVVGERVEFAQSLMTYTGPSKEFERRVSAGLVQHSKNPVMDWQVGHCEVWSDRNQNIRPVKPNPHSGKSVDGVICGVMTTTGVMKPVEDSSINPHILVI